MKKIISLLFLIATVQSLFAQHAKVSLTQGIGIDPSKKNDSLFFAKNYLVTQLRIGYHYGRIGLIANIQYIKQNNVNGEGTDDPRIPAFSKLRTPQYSDVQTLQTALGVEICIPVIKRKAQLNFYSTYGRCFSKSGKVGFIEQDSVSYQHTVIPINTGCWQLGASFNYKINKRLAIKWQNEYNQYLLPFDGKDLRKTPSGYTGKQSKKLIISLLGVQYTF